MKSSKVQRTYNLLGRCLRRPRQADKGPPGDFRQQKTDLQTTSILGDDATVPSRHAAFTLTRVQ